MTLKGNTLVSKILDSSNEVDPILLKRLLVLIIDTLENNPLANFSGEKLNVVFSSAKTDEPVRHGLNFTPEFAIIVKQVTSTPTVTFNFSKFTNKDIFITTDGAVELDILVGKIDE